MADPVAYKYLQPKRGGSNYRQLFVLGRIRAEVLYRETVGPELLPAEEVAREYQVPVEAVLEAIDFHPVYWTSEQYNHSVAWTPQPRPGATGRAGRGRSAPPCSSGPPSSCPARGATP